MTAQFTPQPYPLYARAPMRGGWLVCLVLGWRFDPAERDPYPVAVLQCPPEYEHVAVDDAEFSPDKFNWGGAGTDDLVFGPGVVAYYAENTRRKSNRKFVETKGSELLNGTDEPRRSFPDSNQSDTYAGARHRDEQARRRMEERNRENGKNE